MPPSVSRLLLLAALAATPATAQVSADRPLGGMQAAATGLEAFAGRRVAAIEITGNNVTREWVITREVRTKVGAPLDVDEVGRDVARLDNLSIFAEIRVDALAVGDDAVRLVYTFKEMPSPGRGSAATTSRSTSTGRATRVRTSCAGSRRRATSSPPRLGSWIGEHGWVRGKFSYFEMKSDTAGILLSDDGSDNLLRLGASVGWDTRDSWRDPRRG